jgi:hypothetical protein
MVESTGLPLFATVTVRRAHAFLQTIKAEAENMYQNIARYYRYIKDADAQAEALNASLSKEKISGFLKELFGILDTEN